MSSADDINPSFAAVVHRQRGDYKLIKYSYEEFIELIAECSGVSSGELKGMEKNSLFALAIKTRKANKNGYIGSIVSEEKIYC